MNKTLFKLLLISIISCSLSGQAFAVYKHKVIVADFDDPQGWKESYHPGKILSRNLKQQLMIEGRFHMFENSSMRKMPDSGRMNEADRDGNMRTKDGPDKKSAMNKPQMMSALVPRTQFKSDKYKMGGGYKKKSYPAKVEGSNASYQRLEEVEPAVRYINNDLFAEILPVQDLMMGEKGKMPPAMATMMHDPVPWPVRLGSMPAKASLFEIRGQVVKFDPGNRDGTITDKNKMNITENANLEVMLQLIQNKTGRVVYKQKFRAFSNSGRRPFSKDIDLRPEEGLGLESSSMSLALSFVSKEMVTFVNNTIFTEPLEGEIIAIKNDDVLINVGSQNGVQVGDRFRVHSLGLRLDDPLTGHDLGDIYVKMGAIQVLQSMLGFSRARIIVGKDFMPGNLVRSFKKFKNSGQQFSEGSTKNQEPVIWWDFHGIKSVP